MSVAQQRASRSSPWLWTPLGAGTGCPGRVLQAGKAALSTAGKGGGGGHQAADAEAVHHLGQGQRWGDGKSDPCSATSHSRSWYWFVISATQTYYFNRCCFSTFINTPYSIFVLDIIILNDLTSKSCSNFSFNMDPINSVSMTLWILSEVTPLSKEVWAVINLTHHGWRGEWAYISRGTRTTILIEPI